MKNELTAKRLIFALDRINMKAQELADRTGLNKASISQYVNGTHSPSNLSAGKMAKVLGVSPVWLMGFDVPMFDERITPVAPTEDYMYIPLYSSVSAGHGCFADGNIEEFIPVPSYLGDKEDFFALRVKGNSMEPQIMDGDILVAKKNLEPKDGETVIAIVNGDEGFCKRLVRYSHMLGLVSNNPEYDPLMFTEQEVIDKPVIILGTVEQLIRKF